MILSGPTTFNPALRTTSANLPGIVASTDRPVGPEGWMRGGMDQGKSQLWLWPQDAAVAAMQEVIKQKLGDKLTEKFGRVCERAKHTGYEDVLHPVGVASVLGVDVAAGKLNAAIQQDAGFSITYRPTPWQQWYADWMIYLASQRRFLREVGRISTNETVPQGRLMQMLVAPIAEITGTALSVSYFVGPGKPWVTRIPGYGHNPIQPTELEMTARGGMNHYWARGGFLLDQRLVTGEWLPNIETNTQTGQKLYVTNGYGLCDGKVIATVAGFPEDRKWRVGVKIDSAGTYYLSVKLKPDEVAEARDMIQRAWNEVRDFLCRNQDLLRGLGESMRNDPKLPAESRAAATGGLIVLDELNCPPGSDSGGGGGGGGKGDLDNKDTAERSWWDTLPRWQQGALVAGGAAAAVAIVRKTQRG